MPKGFTDFQSASSIDTNITGNKPHHVCQGRKLLQDSVSPARDLTSYTGMHNFTSPHKAEVLSPKLNPKHSFTLSPAESYDDI